MLENLLHSISDNLDTFECTEFGLETFETLVEHQVLDNHAASYLYENLLVTDENIRAEINQNFQSSMEVAKLIIQILN